MGTRKFAKGFVHFAEATDAYEAQKFQYLLAEQGFRVMDPMHEGDIWWVPFMELEEFID